MFNNITNIFLLFFFTVRPHVNHVVSKVMCLHSNCTYVFQPEEFRHNYISRNTAQGLCDPWVDLRMDHDILPKIGSAQRT
jgi:hypothetical protein